MEVADREGLAPDMAGGPRSRRLSALEISGSSAREGRDPLFEERAHALALVLAGEAAWKSVVSSLSPSSSGSDSAARVASLAAATATGLLDAIISATPSARSSSAAGSVTSSTRR